MKPYSYIFKRSKCAFTALLFEQIVCQKRFGFVWEVIVTSIIGAIIAIICSLQKLFISGKYVTGTAFFWPDAILEF
jgi:hypothetical protein